MATKTLRPAKIPKQKKVARTADIIINGRAHIPAWVVDHDSFRNWACSKEFPTRGQFFFIDGKLWVDLSMETLVHNQIKLAISIVLGAMVLDEVLGKFLADRMLLTHLAVGLTCEPDAMFVSNHSLESGRVVLTQGDESLETLGTPDMALEVVSQSSIQKDTIDLKELYARAGIAEYWLVDSTSTSPELQIHRLVAGKYVVVRQHNGWVKSRVFRRSFRLNSTRDAAGLSSFRLEVKSR